jgi:hypothetical protein
MSEQFEDGLLGRVGRVLSLAETPPADVVRQAKEAFAWRDISMGLALLDYDSAVDDDGMARVRSGTRDRQLSFRGPLGVIEVSVLAGGQRLVGRVEPVGAGAVVLRQPSGTRTTAADRFGQFIFESIDRGPVSIRWQPEDSSPGFDTEWVTL